MFLFIAASNIQSGWLYIIDSLIISILVYSIINPISQISKLDFKRVFHGNFNENNNIEIETFIINNSNKKINFLKIETDLPIRIIDNKKYGYLKNNECFIIEIDKKSQTSYISNFTTDLRGLYDFSTIKVSSHGALGLVKYTKIIKKQSILTVFPIIEQIRLETASLSLSNTSSNYSKQLKKFQDNYIPYNIREYKAGDPFRLINWKASAKRFQLMVKEVEAENSTNFKILMDTFKNNKIGELKNSNLEYMLKICSGIFKYIVLNKYKVEIIYFDKDKMQIITETTSSKDFLSHMASLDTNSNIKLIDLIDNSNYKEVIIAFFLKPDEQDIEKLNHFYDKGFKIIPFFIETKSFDKNISSSHILNCKFKNIKIQKSYNFSEKIFYY
jgi:uncharacterized protein (DUF58 family)